MNIRNNKGITLIALVITVIILMILTYVIISISVGITSTVKFQNIETYMMLIKSKCETLSNEVVIGEKQEKDLYGEKQTSGQLSGWYRLKQSELEELGLEKAQAEDRILC